MISHEWQRHVLADDPTTEAAVERLQYLVRDDGFVEVEESVLAQLLLDAGWERWAWLGEPASSKQTKHVDDLFIKYRYVTQEQP